MQLRYEAECLYLFSVIVAKKMSAPSRKKYDWFLVVYVVTVA